MALNTALASQERADTSQDAEENKDQPTRKDKSSPRPASRQKGKKTKLDTEDPKQDKQKNRLNKKRFFILRNLFYKNCKDYKYLDYYGKNFNKFFYDNYKLEKTIDNKIKILIYKRQTSNK